MKILGKPIKTYGPNPISIKSDLGKGLSDKARKDIEAIERSVIRFPYWKGK